MPRERLNRDRVLQAAVALADRAGIDAVSMRALAQDLGVVPMALYKHVRDKDELLDGMVDVLIDEFESPDPATGLKGGDPAPAAVRAAGGAAPPVGPQGDRVAHPPYADRAGLHG